jgi:hypothetical protein
MDFQAVPNVGKTVLIIKDNTVVGEGMVSALADGQAAITISSAEAKEFFKDDEAVATFGWESLFFYWQQTGYPAHQPLEPINRYKGTRIVDRFNFDWGMVPDSFLDVPGYRAAQLHAIKVCEEGAGTGQSGKGSVHNTLLKLQAFSEENDVQLHNAPVGIGLFTTGGFAVLWSRNPPERATSLDDAVARINAWLEENAN